MPVRADTTRGGRWLVIACATVAEELGPLLPAHVVCKSLEFGLHLVPSRLRETLQAEVDAATYADTILLGYGLCANGVVGLRAAHARLVIPRIDDCVGIFLGSRQAYQQQVAREPGTFYLTKGWIECGDTPISEYERMAAKYGEERALWLSREALKHYSRVALIDTGQYHLSRYRAYARRMAEFYGWRFEEIAGCTSLLAKLTTGQWDDQFVVVEPGEAITADMFALW